MLDGFDPSSRTYSSTRSVGFIIVTYVLLLNMLALWRLMDRGRQSGCQRLNAGEVEKPGSNGREKNRHG
jgi:hypothetical protein